MRILICTTKCPELQYDEIKHCVECKDGYIHKYVREHGCCPVGHTPDWKVW